MKFNFIFAEFFLNASAGHMRPAGLQLDYTATDNKGSFFTKTSLSCLSYADGMSPTLQGMSPDESNQML